MAKKQAKRGGAREGAGRPVGEEGPAVTIVASIPKSLADGFYERTKVEGWGRSKGIQEAIKALLKRKGR
jgi:hypothetical protein